MKNKKWLRVGIVLTIILIGVGIFLFINFRPVAQAEQRAKEDNQWLDEKKRLYEEEKKSPDYAEHQKKYWAKIQPLVDHAQSRIQKLDLYGKVVDQYGTPVAGVEIVFDAGGIFLASSTGRGKITTDEQGLFNIDDAKGVSLAIANMSKPGYQFKTTDGEMMASGNPHRLPTEAWNETTKREPAIFTIWKVERFPNVKKGRTNLYALPDGNITTLDFLDRGRLTFKKGLSEGDLTIALTRKDESWHVKISALGGGLQERKSVYTYLAPEDGYVETWEYTGMSKGETSNPRKEFFFKSRNGIEYGYITLNFYPYFKEEFNIDISYVANLEKTRDLTIKEENLQY